MSGIALSIIVVLLALASSTVCELTNRSSHCMIEAATATLRLCAAPSSAQLQQQNRTSTPAEITAPDCCLYQQHCIDAAVVLRVVCDLQPDNTKDLIKALGTSKGKRHQKKCMLMCRKVKGYMKQMYNTLLLSTFRIHLDISKP